ncbi:hypothetical protein ROA7450_01983 [Roseovarius albus]|uniref:Argininosuccinate lyase n=1 Tax=Roseovarius albus TaxID=1247867 RepID=A0A1X6Z4Y7_9RHOB|nr:hypothetical protein [Roseovarius albus]SLN40990.1 hypothetical protein ROA7450_01983 [Roseovarius albus]
MRIAALIVALGLLAGCGADGEPFYAPSATTVIGVGSNGVHANVGVSTQVGPVTVGVGI